MASANLIDPDRIRMHLTEAERIGVIGLKPRGVSANVSAFMSNQGYEIEPVNPKYDECLGTETHDRVSDIPGRVDIVDIFRSAEHIPGHVDEILEMEPLPRLVWFQLGIRNEEAAKRLADAGIDVIQDRCIKVEYSRLMGV